MREIVYYVSGHGFGHSVRSSLVVGELYALGFHCHIVSSAPRFIFECNLRGIPFGYVHDTGDIGVSQRTSIEVDIAGTRTGWEKLLSGEGEWTRRQLALCEKVKPCAVVSDIVPFAFPLAKRLGVPAALVATFTWDWILAHYSDDDPAFAGISARVADYYLMADRMIYTPFSYGLPDIETTDFVPLIGRKSGKGKEELREELGLDSRPAFLVSFGGIGLREMEELGLDKMDGFQFLFLSPRKGRRGNLFTYSNDETLHADLVAASDAVITKPGYGISAETVLNRVPMIYTSRGKFAEYEPMVEELKKYIPARFISNEGLFNGGLMPYLENPPSFSGEVKYLMDSGTGAREAARLIASLASG